MTKETLQQTLPETKLSKKELKIARTLIAEAINSSFDSSLEDSTYIEQSYDDYQDDLTGLYLKEIDALPLLTKEEEKDRINTMIVGQKKSKKLSELPQNSNPTTEENQSKESLSEKIDQGIAARDDLIFENTRLVVSIAKQFEEQGLDLLDRIQEGNIGLMRAVHKLDPEKDNKVSTYAHDWIDQTIRRAIFDQGFTIRVPVYLGERINKIRQVKHLFEQEAFRNPTIEELSEIIDLTSNQVINALKASRRPLSLNHPTLTSDGDLELESAIEDINTPDPSDIEEDFKLTIVMLEALLTIPQREREVLELRYGLIDEIIRTQKEVGEKIGVSHQRVSRLEQQAIKRLRKPQIIEKLKDYR